MPARSEPYRPDAPIVAELAAGAVLLHDPSGDCLLLHQRDEDRWCFPKGHVDPGESLAVAAVREIGEETGLTEVRLDVELTEVSYRFYRPKTSENVYKTTVYFLAYTRERSTHAEKIFDRTEWFDLASARVRVKYPTDRRVIDAAIRHRPPRRRTAARD